MKTRSLIAVGLILACLSLSAFYVNEAKAGSTLYVKIVDSVTGESLNGIDVKASWGSNMEKHQEIYSQSGDAIFENMGDNYVGDVLISVSDNAGRYFAKNELVHADLQQLSTSNAEIKLERVTPLQSTHSGNYITSFIQDRSTLYYQESAYLIIGLKSPYPNPELIVNVPDGLYSYGAGSISMFDSDTKTVTVRIQNNMFIDSQKTVTFNVSFYENGYSLESVPVTLNIQPSTGSTVLNVKIVDATDKEGLAGSVTAWWGSNFWQV